MSALSEAQGRLFEAAEQQPVEIQSVVYGPDGDFVTSGWVPALTLGYVSHAHPGADGFWIVSLLVKALAESRFQCGYGHDFQICADRTYLVRISQTSPDWSLLKNETPCTYPGVLKIGLEADFVAAFGIAPDCLDSAGLPEDISIRPRSHI